MLLQNHCSDDLFFELVIVLIQQLGIAAFLEIRFALFDQNSSLNLLLYRFEAIFTC